MIVDLNLNLYQIWDLQYHEYILICYDYEF